MVSQLPKVKIDGVEYFMDARLKEYRRTDIPFMSRSFEEVRSSSDTVDIVTLRIEDLGKPKTTQCINTAELSELRKLPLSKKSESKLKKVDVCPAYGFGD